MALRTPTLRAAQWPAHALPRQTCTRAFTTTQQRRNPAFEALRHEMTTRAISPIFDDLTPTPSARLTTSLSDFLPASAAKSSPAASGTPPPLPLPHHLIYFEPAKSPSLLLPDGTNPDQSPGDPYTRRMWAGGSVLYNTKEPLRLDASRSVCAEFIRDVTSKGKPGEEKLFVRIERRIARASGDEAAASLALSDGEEGEAGRELGHLVRQRLWRDEDDDFGPCGVLETRNIVFMRPRAPAEALAAAQEGGGGKMLRPSREADWTHSVIPDPRLLFRFSALTFNAHAIHLDPEFCRNVEGHRERLVHGPLTFVFLMEVLQQKLAKGGGKKSVKSVEYRNLAPLYCNEPVKFCGARVGEDKWEVWAETPEGGVAVRGTVGTESAS